MGCTIFWNLESWSTADSMSCATKPTLEPDTPSFCVYVFTSIAPEMLCNSTRLASQYFSLFVHLMSASRRHKWRLQLHLGPLVYSCLWIMLQLTRSPYILSDFPCLMFPVGAVAWRGGVMLIWKVMLPLENTFWLYEKVWTIVVRVNLVTWDLVQLDLLLTVNKTDAVESLACSMWK